MALRKLIWLIFFFINITSFALGKEKIILENKVVKKLESNRGTKIISAQVDLNGIFVDEENFVHVKKLESPKYKIQNEGTDLSFINERIEFSGLEIFVVDFLLIKKKPKTYVIKNIRGIESVEEYSERVLKTELERQREKNESLGFGRFTDEQIERQKNINHMMGYGNIPDAVVKIQQEKNLLLGYGKITDEEIVLEQIENSEKGYGQVTEFELALQRERNESSGYGKISNEEMKIQKERNTKIGLGNVTDVQAINQKMDNFDRGLGSVTDFQAETQKSINEKNGLGHLTDAQVHFQIMENEKKGYGLITDTQVLAQRKFNFENGLGKFTDEEILVQKNKNRQNGYGECSDFQRDERFGLIAKEIEKAKKAEEKNNLIEALGIYYDIAIYNPGGFSKEATASYNRIADSILDGSVCHNDGQWKNLCIQFQKYWCDKGIMNFSKPSIARKFDCDENEKIFYLIQFEYKNSFKYLVLKNLLEESINIAEQKNNSAENYMDYILVDEYQNLLQLENYYIEFCLVDSDGKNISDEEKFLVCEQDNVLIELDNEKSVSDFDIKIINFYCVDENKKIENQVEHPQFHMVQIPGQNFKIMTTEVTQELFYFVMNENPGKHNGLNLPVENVSQVEAKKFCNKLSLLEGFEPVYSVNGETDVLKWNESGKIVVNKNANGFRIPDGNDWKRARGEILSEDKNSAGWFESNSQNKTHSVAMKQENQYGIFDMDGNVSEWVSSIYYQDDGEDLVYFGSSYVDEYNDFLNWDHAENQFSCDDYIGFRVVQSVE